MGNFYTEEKIANARKNIKQYNWAHKEKESAVESAESYLKPGIDFLWHSVTGQRLPRSFTVNYYMGSPMTGKAFLKQYGMYGWKADPVRAPWKITDPSSGFQFPTNDFHAYYRSGLDEQGLFDPDRADRRLLVNELYPDKGEKWGVDDGFGWVDADGNKWTFVAYYNHWHVWHGGVVDSALKALTNAYLFTGEKRFAQAGLVLLDRIADVYPSMDIGAHKKVAGFHNSNGGTDKGKVRGSIWEAGAMFQYLAACDAFMPAIAEADVVGFLQSKAERYCLEAPKHSPEAILRNIQDGIIRQVFPAVKAADIQGNFPMHQRALTMAAVVLDEPEETREWIDFVLRPGRLESWPDYHVTGGNVLATLIHSVDRDGFGNEASPQYNSYWLGQMEQIADILRTYKGPQPVDLFENVKLRKMYHTRYPLFMIGKYTPTIGDMFRLQNMDFLWNSRSPCLVGTVMEHAAAFEKYGDPVFAQVAYFLNGSKLEGLHGGIFSDTEKIVRETERVIEQFGPFRPASVNLSGYGFAALRDGVGDNARDLWLYYGRNPNHGHKDTLNIGLFAFGLDLSPDLGYPERTGPDPMRMEWVNHTVSHNTVLVDHGVQRNQWVGIPHHYDATSRIKLIDVEAPEVYPQTDMYRRTVALIRVDDLNSYAVDFFRVQGGSEHHYSFHGGEGTVVTEGLILKAQPTGTYAGPDVPYGQRESDSTEGWEYAGSGFHYLTGVERDSSPPSVFSVDWKLKDTLNMLGTEKDIHLRLTLLAELDEAALADGIPPQIPGNPERLKYLIAHRKGDQLKSLFTAVLEPYVQDGFIVSVNSIPLLAAGQSVDRLEATALKVVLTCGRVDYIVNTIRPDIRYTSVDGHLEFKCMFGMVSAHSGVPNYAYIHDGTWLSFEGKPLIQQERGALTGSIQDFTRDLRMVNEITARFEEADFSPDLLTGKTIYIDNDRIRNATYVIRGAKKTGDNLFVLDIGDMTLIREYADPKEPGQGYIYDVCQGQPFRITMTYEWE